MRWRRAGDALLVDDWTPDLVAERNEKLAWLVSRRRPWALINGQLIPRGERRQPVEDALQELMEMGRGEWRSRMKRLALSGTATAGESTFGILGAYPTPAELPAVTPTATESGLLTAAQAQVYMPIPMNGILAAQAYRFIVSGRSTLSATAANYTWTPRLGNTNAAPSLTASAAVAKVVSITNAIFIWKGDITIQATGVPGTNSKGFGHFTMHLNNTATPGAGAIVWAWGSTAAASFDTTVPPPGATGTVSGGQLWLGVTASAAAADTFTVGQVHWMDWN